MNEVINNITEIYREVKSYKRDNIDLNNIAFNKNTNAFNSNNINSLINKIFREGPTDPWFKFTVIKYLYYNCDNKVDLIIKSRLLKQLIDISWYIGEYSETKKLSIEWLEFTKKEKKGDVSVNRCRVLNRKAKALRNLGEFEEAFDTYRNILKICEKEKLIIEKAYALIMVGKMYGNYQSQNSTFAYFIYQALNLLNKLFVDNFIINRYKAICYDSLGQIYSVTETDWKKAFNFFNEARRINEEIKNNDGLSRNLCHISMLKSKWDQGENPKENLRIFNHGYHLLINDFSQKRAWGIRKIQRGILYAKIDKKEFALETIKTGRDISLEYKDYRTYIRSRIEQADLSIDSEEKIDSLKSALGYAKKYRLNQLELEINKRLGNLYYTLPSLADIPESIIYFQKNREILLDFQSKVIINRNQISAPDNLDKIVKKSIYPEFRRLSKLQKIQLYDALLQDYDLIIDQLKSNFQIILGISEKIKEVALLEITQSLVRAIRHDIKYILPRQSGGGIWEELRIGLDDTYNKLAELNSRIGKNIIPESTIDSINQLRKDVIYLFNQFKTIDEIFFSKRVYSSKSRLIKCCDLAVKKILTEEGILNEEIVKIYTVDVELPCSTDLLTSSIIALLRNGLESRKESENKKTLKKIEIKISKEITGNKNLGNNSYIIKLDISNKGNEGDSHRIRNAFESPGITDKVDGSGIGIELINLILIKICKAEYEIFEMDGYTHICFNFRPDGVRIKELNRNDDE